MSNILNFNHPVLTKEQIEANKKLDADINEMMKEVQKEKEEMEKLR